MPGLAMGPRGTRAGSGRIRLGLALAAAATEAEEFQGVEQGRETGQILSVQMDVVDRAMGQNPGAAAIHAGEVMLVPFAGGVEGLSARQMAATHHPPLLQLAQVAIDGGQPHGTVPTAQARVQVLASQFAAGPLQFAEQPFLTAAEQALLAAAGRAGGWGGAGSEGLGLHGNVLPRRQPERLANGSGQVQGASHSGDGPAPPAGAGLNQAGVAV